MAPLQSRVVVLRTLLWCYFHGLTRAGRWFVWPSLAFLAYALVSIRGQLFLPASYGLALWLVALVASRVWRPRVQARVEHVDRVGAGEELPVFADIQALGPRTGHDLRFTALPLPAGLVCVPEDGVALPTMAPGMTTQVRLGIRCLQRGAYLLTGFCVETDFPFGIVRSAATLPHPRRLLVHPKFRPLAQLDVPAGRRHQPGGVALASVVGESAEYMGNREYREGDPVRDIDWRATARLQRPIVREWREEYFLRVAVILDTQVPAAAPAARRRDFEAAVSLGAAVGDFLARQEYIVDLFAAGPNLYHLTAGRSLAYLDQILDILACLEPSMDSPFAHIEPELCENLSAISAVFCIFLDWDESRRAFAETLRRQGVGLRVLVVRSAACTLDPASEGIQVIADAMAEDA